MSVLADGQNSLFRCTPFYSGDGISKAVRGVTHNMFQWLRPQILFISPFYRYKRGRREGDQEANRPRASRVKKPHKVMPPNASRSGGGHKVHQ